MKLKKILKDVDYLSIKGPKDPEITGICNDSRRAAPGNLFIARKGLCHDGSAFIYDAISSGAIAVITDMVDPFLPNITQVLHKNVAAIEADIAANYYEHPSKNLFIVGITGTKGKTTTSYLIKKILDHFQIASGLIGGVENIAGTSCVPSTHTTPDAVTCQKLLREMVKENCQAAVMEVTSQGLDQGRVKHIEFDIALFTNLTSDHLDYHKTWEAYAKVKEKLFTSLISKQKKEAKVAIINLDDPYAATLIAKTPAKVFTYGFSSKADLYAIDMHYSIKGTQFTLIHEGKSYPVTTNLVGKFNVYNLLAAFSVGIVKKLPIEEMIDALKSFTGVPGRVERIPVKKDFHVFVDHAHTEDSLEKVLSALKQVHVGHIITVFGCGGDRDRSKRSKMGAVSQRLSDMSIITSDNPRKEDPEKIAQEISEGFSTPEKYLVVLDRKLAIEKAFQLAQKGDLILIAGKGHEHYQIFASKTLPFNDKEVALSLGR